MLVRPLEADVNKANKELSDLQKVKAIFSSSFFLFSFILKLALQRGEKLGNLEKRTEEMVMQASAYAENASKLANKYKKKSQWPFS
jgi:preprotein translocase subunit SecG